jgi:hypothetical protein
VGAFLDTLLNGIKNIANGGAVVPHSGLAPTLNFVSGATATFNPSTSAFDVVIPGGGASTPVLVGTLRSTPPAASDATQMVDGFAAQGDGGEGIFFWKSTDTRPDNGGTILQVTGISTGRWNRMFSGPLSLKWFGAHGDGQRVLDATSGAGTSLVSSPSATFTALDVGKLCTLYGLGPSASIAHGTITALITAHQVQVSFVESGGVSGTGIFIWGSDDTAVISAALSAAKSNPNLPSLFIPSGRYCVTSGFALDATFAGLSIAGASYWHVGTIESEIILMAPAAYVIRNTAQGMSWSDLWLDGNRLADNVLDWDYFGDSQTFDRCRFSGATSTGAIHHYGVLTGALEIDFLTYRDCFLVADFYDSTYLAGQVVLNENAQAFQINYYDGELRGGNFLNQNTNQGSCNFRGTQVFGWGDTAFWVNSGCASFELKDIYNESDTLTFLKIVPNAFITSFTVLTMSNCHLQTTPIYTSHTMRLVMRDCTTGANITSDPGAALQTGVGQGTIDYGLQPLILDNCSLVNSAALIIASGDGSLVETRNTGLYGTATIDVTDGAIVSGTKNLACATSTPFTAQSVGLPVHVINAGVPTHDLWSWIVAFTDTGHVKLNDAAGNTVSGATVHIGNIGTLTPFGYVASTTTPRSPTELVGNSGYDADGLYLAVGRTPVGAGVPMLARDTHGIGTLTAPRSYIISNLGAEAGSRMHVFRPGSDTNPATFTFGTTPTTLVLLGGEWATFRFMQNAGWQVSALGSLGQSVPAEGWATNASPVVNTGGVFTTIASVTITPRQTGKLKITATSMLTPTADASGMILLVTDGVHTALLQTPGFDLESGKTYFQALTVDSELGPAPQTYPLGTAVTLSFKFFSSINSVTCPAIGGTLRVEEKGA